MTLGKYIPIEVLIDTLLANRTSDCDKLRQQLNELQGLLDAYMKLELTPEQQKALAGFVNYKSNIRKNLLIVK